MNCSACGEMTPATLLYPYHIRPKVIVRLCRTCYASAVEPLDINEYYREIAVTLDTILKKMWQNVETPQWFEIAVALNDLGWKGVRGDDYTVSSTYKLFQHLHLSRTRIHAFEQTNVPLPISQGQDAFPIDNTPQDCESVTEYHNYVRSQNI